MAEKVVFRLTPETRKLIPEHEDFYASILDLYAKKQSPLGLKSRDSEARTEAEVQANGDVEVTLVLPLDDNEQSGDGRLYLKDRFLFDPTHKVLKGYRREFEFNGQGDSQVWRDRLAKYQELLKDKPKLNDRKIQGFGLAVARSYGLPFVDEKEQTLAKFKDAFQREHRYLDSTDSIIQAAGQAQGVEGLRLRIKDRENHYQVFRYPGDRTELILNFAVDRDGAGDNGRIWLQERLVFAKTKLSSFSREWTVDPRSAANPKVAAVLEGLKAQGLPNREEMTAFAENLFPSLVPQESPDPNSVTPLLAASVNLSPAPSVFKEREEAGAGVLSAQKQILDFALNLAAEDIAKRAESAQGLLQFQDKVDATAERSSLDSLFDKLKSAVEKFPGRNLLRLLSGLDLNEGEALQRDNLEKFPILQELLGLGQERDTGLRNRQLLRIAEILLDRNFPGSALLISEALKARGKLGERAGRLSELAQGKGDFGARAEASFRHIHEEWTKPSMLVGMMAAPLVGVAFEASALRGARWLYDMNKLSKMGSAVKFGASTLGMVGEAAAFTGIHRGFERLSSGSEKAWQGAGGELISSLLLFGSMRAAHAGGGFLSSRMAEGKFNFNLGNRSFVFGQRKGNELLAAEFSATTPTGRMLLGNPWAPSPGVGTPTLSALGAFSSGLLQHVGSVGAMRLAAWASEQGGITPMGANGEANLFDTIMSYVQAMFGFRLANRATMNRLQPALGEAKMRVETAHVTIPTSANPLARTGLFEPVIPELRIFDVQGGSRPIDFRLRPGQSIALDPLLFSQNTQTVMVGRDMAGTIHLIDRRAQVDSSFYNRPAHHVRISDPLQTAILHNNAPLPVRQLTPLVEGDQLRLGFRSLAIFQPRRSMPFVELAALSPNRQLQLGLRIDAAASIDALVQSLAGECPNVSEYVRKVWEGQNPLHSLPFELGLLNKVESLIQAELRKGEREGIDENAVSLRPDFPNPRWSTIEKSFQINRAIETLQEDLKGAASTLEMGNILQQSPFSAIERQAIRDLRGQINQAAVDQKGIQALPYTAGIRQRVRDMVERQNYWASVRNRGGPPQPTDPTMQPEYNQIYQGTEALYHQVRHSSALRQEAPEYSVAQLEELLYQVLERGQPLEILPSADGLRGTVRSHQREVIRQAERLFPVEMNVHNDPWTGEMILSTNPEAKFRLASHVLNVGARRPVLGMPSTIEIQELNRLVNAHLDSRVRNDFLRAQKVLREHFDNATPQAQKLLKAARPKEKALLLAMYFGPFRRRDLAPATAFQVSTWMGQAGMFREVGVTYEVQHDALRATLSLGNLSNVEPQHRDDFFALHTHPEGYRNRHGLDMGWENRGVMQTMNLDQASISRSTLSILPSRIDLRLYYEKSKEYWRMGNPMRFGDTPLFETGTNRFKNWVVHSLGLSRIDVQLGPNGEPQGIHVRFAARRLASLLNSEYQKQKVILEAMSSELHVPVTVTEATYDELMSEMPYGVHSLHESLP